VYTGLVCHDFCPACRERFAALRRLEDRKDIFEFAMKRSHEILKNLQDSDSKEEVNE
jgi:hypothetical protein